MNPGIDRQKAVELLKKYNKDSFHLQHASTVEGVMRWFANNLGFAEDEDLPDIIFTFLSNKSL